MDLKVHVEIFHYKEKRVRTCSRFFFAKALAIDFEMRPPRKINVGFTKIRLSKFVIHEEWPFADKGI